VIEEAAKCAPFGPVIAALAAAALPRMLSIRPRATTRAARPAQVPSSGATKPMKESKVPTAGQAGSATADLQDHLLSAAHDLDRLQALLSNACASLLQGFYGATDQMRTLLHAPSSATDDEAFERAMQHLGTAVIALQFQDMASQLIDHTHRRLQTCAERLAQEACHCNEPSLAETPPIRPNPVAQALMDAGSVELF
jgi:hypothetical protein